MSRPPAQGDKKLFRRVLQIFVEHTGRSGIPAAFGKSDHFHHPHAVIEPHGQDIAKLHPMAGRLLAGSVDAHMPGLDQRSGAGAGLHDSRVP